ncbi:MAG TPA: winged helix-turn-helix domain-containing protein [Candidatus Limnocylindria bacterium]|nr:winged helix-turn-helix domain-containing protein [Candidatus Limnocylindria bacterium]
MTLEPCLILIVSADARATRAIRGALVSGGALTATCARARDVRGSLSFHRPSVAVVDVAMERGWDALCEVRSSGTAVVVLDGARDRDRRRTAFAAGADDVVAWPADPDEVAARALALAARARDAVTRRVHRANGLVFDADSRAVAVDGHSVALTAHQLTILEALFEARGAAVGRALLADRIAGIDDEPPSDRAVDLHVSRLRRRVGDDAARPRFIETVPGLGYRLVAADPRSRPPLSPDAASLLEALPRPMLVVGRDLTVCAANGAACALTGLSPEEMAGRRCGDILDCRDGEGVALLPRCLGRMSMLGAVPLHGVDGSVLSPDGRVAVRFSCGRVRGTREGDVIALSLETRPA